MPKLINEQGGSPDSASILQGLQSNEKTDLKSCPFESQLDVFPWKRCSISFANLENMA